VIILTINTERKLLPKTSFCCFLGKILIILIS
jgi:hypothetical protein